MSHRCMNSGHRDRCTCLSLRCQRRPACGGDWILQKLDLSSSYWEQIYEVAKRWLREKYSQLNHITLSQCQIISLCKAYRTICLSLEPARTSFCVFFFFSRLCQWGEERSREQRERKVGILPYRRTIKTNKLLGRFMFSVISAQSHCHMKQRAWEIVRGTEECLVCLQGY